MGDNALTGEIPPELGLISGLTGLALNDNGLTGEIPVELGNLSNLRNLNVGNNMLTGEVPSELGSLAALEYLDLRGNDLTGCLPACGTSLNGWSRNLTIARTERRRGRPVRRPLVTWLGRALDCC